MAVGEKKIKNKKRNNFVVYNNTEWRKQNTLCDKIHNRSTYYFLLKNPLDRWDRLQLTELDSNLAVSYSEKCSNASLIHHCDLDENAKSSRTSGAYCNGFYIDSSARILSVQFFARILCFSSSELINNTVLTHGGAQVLRSLAGCVKIVMKVFWVKNEINTNSLAHEYNSKRLRR